MKKLLPIIHLMLLAFTSKAQVLYTENFDNLAIGVVNTDPTGLTTGKGGWYTFYSGDNPNIASPEIVSETGRGNLLKLPSVSIAGNDYYAVFRNDLLSYWKQRQRGNNILKISFDFYTGDAGNSVGGATSDHSRIDIMNIDGDYIIGYQFIANTNAQYLRASHPKYRYNILNPKKYYYLTNDYAYAMPNEIRFKPNQWITLELIIDYYSNKLYFSIPSLNYTIVRDSDIQLGLGEEGHDDSPVTIIFSHFGHTLTKDYYPKFDNISMSAHNTTPKLSNHQFLATKFNLYPNPANKVVTIANEDNLPVQQIKIYDIAGKQLSTQTYNNEAEVQLNVEHLAVGTYMLHIQTTKGTAVKQLVKK